MSLTTSGRRRGRLLSGLLAIVAALGVMVTLPASAAAGSPYDGIDPNLSGCTASASTVASSYISVPRNPDEGFGSSEVVGLVELRYSPVCGTKWARITDYYGQWVGWPYHVFVEADLGAGSFRQIEYGNYYSAWTNMIYAPALGSPAQLVCVSGEISGLGSTTQPACV